MINELEQKIIDCFDNELNSPFFENNFKLSLSDKSIVKYNLWKEKIKYWIIN
jgi:hypothetical protein